MERIESKIRAKELLKGRWGNAVGATLVFWVISFIVSFIVGFLIPVLGGILGSLFSMYMLLCFVMYCIKLTEKEGIIKYGECFLDALTFFKILGAQILVGIISMVIPFVIICIGAMYIAFSKSPIAMIILSSGIILGSIFSILVTLIFFTLPFIFIENDEIGVMDGIKKAIAISKGFKWKYFIFLLSFIGWIILATLSLGIGFLWLRPYLVLSTYLFYKHMIGEYKKVE